MSLLRKASIEGDLEKIKQIEISPKEDYSPIGYFLPLYDAARNNHKSVIQYFLGLSFLDKPLQYNAILSGAVSGDHKDLVLWAISCGATDFKHAMWQAKWYKRDRMIKLLNKFIFSSST